MNDIKPRVAYLAREVGIDLEEVGPYLNRNPYFLFQPMEDLKVMLILKILFNLYLGSNEVLA
jgi:hypothetical protein